MTTITTRRVTTIGMIGSLILLGFMAYRDVPGYFFTGTDALTQIDTSRIHSLRDISRIFTEPMMNGTSFLQIVHHYRPIAILSYSLDYAIWGLNPVGYHVTDISLHIAVSVLLFLLIRALTGGHRAMAWAGAALFLLHPVHVESVPAIARRHDALALMFMLSSWLLFIKNYRAESPSRTRLGVSLLLFAMALGSKEIAPMLPFLVAAYVGVYDPPQGWSMRALARWLGSSIRPALPYFALAIIYVVWRVSILGGIGGDTFDQFGSDIGSLYRIVKLYLGGILDPYRLIHSLTTSWQVWLAWVAILFWIYCRFVSRAVPRGKREAGPALVLMAIWLAGPLLLYLATTSFAVRYLYVPVAPTCAILGVVIVDSFRSLRRSIERLREGAREKRRRLAVSFAAAGIALVTTAAVAAALLFYSPLVRTYGGWAAMGETAKVLLEGVTEATLDLPNDARVRIYGQPWMIESLTRSKPHVRSPLGLFDYSIKSWLDLQRPDNQIEVTIDNDSRIEPELPPREIRFRVKKEEDGAFGLHAEMLFEEPTDVAWEWRAVGKSYLDAGDPGCAIYYLKRYVEAAAKDRWAWGMLGAAYLDARDPFDAEMCLRRATDKEWRGVDRPFTDLTQMLRGQGRLDDAQEVVDAWLSFERGGPGPYRQAGWICHSTSRYAEAVTYFEKAQQIELDSGTYWGLTLAYLDGLGNSRRAYELTREWIEFDGDEGNAYLMLGLCEMKRGRYKNAMMHLQQAIDEDAEGTYRAYRSLGTAKLSVGNVPAAARTFTRAAAAFPDSAGVCEDAVRVYLKMGRCREAQRWLKCGVERGVSRASAEHLRLQIRLCYVQNPSQAAWTERR